MLKNKIVLCLVVLLFWGQANASNFSVGDLTNDAAAEATAPDGGGATTPTPLPVLVDGDGVTIGVQFRINYNPALFTVVGVPQAGATCNVAPAGTIVMIYNDAGGLPIPAGPLNLCNLTVTAMAQPVSTQIFDVNLAGVGDGCFDIAFNPTVCTAIDAQIDVIAGPVLAPEIDVTPAIVIFNGSVATDIDQVVNISNATGTAALNVTALNLVGGIYSLVGAPGLPFNIAAGASQNITVRCNNPVVAVGVPGSLTVVSNDADEPNVLRNLSCTTNAAPVGPVAQPVPVVGNMGKILLASLVIGLGLLGMGLRRQA